MFKNIIYFLNVHAIFIKIKYTYILKKIYNTEILFYNLSQLKKFLKRYFIFEGH